MARKSTSKRPDAVVHQDAQQSLIRQLIGVIVVAFPVYFVSYTLLHLGGTALWLPPDWRAVVSILGPAVGLAVFQCVRVGRKKTSRKRTKAQMVGQTENVNNRRALFFILVAVVLAVGYYGIKHLCVYHWTGAHDWIQANHPNSLESVPPFIDPQRSTIMVPFVLPPSLRHYFTQVGADPQNAGLGHPLTQTLAEEPDRVIDALDDNKLYLYVQMLPFIAFYMGIMASIGAALGYSFRSGEALGELLASFVRKL